MVLANPDDKGQAELSADTEGEGKIRVEGSYLASVLKACGGMVDLSVTTPISPMLFSHDGYRVVVMPMFTTEAKKAEAEAKKAEATEPKAEKAEPPKPKRKSKGKGKAEPVTEPEPAPELEAEPVTA